MCRARTNRVRARLTNVVSGGVAWVSCPWCCHAYVAIGPCEAASGSARWAMRGSLAAGATATGRIKPPKRGSWIPTLTAEKVREVPENVKRGAFPSRI